MSIFMSEWSKSTYHLKTELMRSQKCTCAQCHRTFRLSVMSFTLVNDRLICTECSLGKESESRALKH